ncbi:Protein wings apart-like [Amphibalanus amphitrite]|uniref:Protein wings apart-like n=1 Tax=Amphibalanus amphitrite TaxID=1232801 RepID=A0A6A4W2U6_AMPAM|nr:Protein wings apart-like [Amphibalanus amphitrite]
MWTTTEEAAAGSSAPAMPRYSHKRPPAAHTASIQFDAGGVSDRKPTAAKSAGTLGKWGVTSFTSIRSSIVNGSSHDGTSSDARAGRSPAAPPADPFSFESNTPGAAPVRKVKKFFKSRNAPPATGTGPTEARRQLPMTRPVPQPPAPPPAALHDDKDELESKKFFSSPALPQPLRDTTTNRANSLSPREPPAAPQAPRMPPLKLRISRDKDTGDLTAVSGSPPEGSGGGGARRRRPPAAPAPPQPTKAARYKSPPPPRVVSPDPPSPAADPAPPAVTGDEDEISGRPVRRTRRAAAVEARQKVAKSVYVEEEDEELVALPVRGRRGQKRRPSAGDLSSAPAPAVPATAPATVPELETVVEDTTPVSDPAPPPVESPVSGIKDLGRYQRTQETRVSPAAPAVSGPNSPQPYKDLERQLELMESGRAAPGSVSTPASVIGSDSGYYTVIKNVKKAYQIQEFGEFQEYNDDIDYIMDALQPTNSLSTRSSLELMLSLLDSDVTASDSDDSNAELRKNRAKVRELCAQLQRQGQAKQLRLDNITAGHLSMETLLSLTSQRAGAWFKEELRELGGLDRLLGTISESCANLRLPQRLRHQRDSIARISRCLRVVENVTSRNEENQQYLLRAAGGEAVASLGQLFQMAETELADCSPTEFQPADGAARILLEMTDTLMKVLVNLSSVSAVSRGPTSRSAGGAGRQSAGGALLGAQPGLLDTLLHAVLRLPEQLPEQKQFDVLLLAMYLLMNLAEGGAENRERIATAEAPARSGQVAFASPAGSALSELLQMFYRLVRLATEVETHTDRILDGTVPAAPPATTAAGQQDAGEVTATALIQKAGHHMEKTVIAAYIGVLVGHLVMDNPEREAAVRAQLNGNKFSDVIEVLRKLLSFMDLTNTGRPETAHEMRTMKRVIDFMVKADEAAGGGGAPGPVGAQSSAGGPSGYGGASFNYEELGVLDMSL